MEEVEQTRQQVREAWEKKRESDRNYLFDHADENLVRWAEGMRLGNDSGDGGGSGSGMG